MSSEHIIRVLLAVNDAGPAESTPDAAGPERALLGILFAPDQMADAPAQPQPANVPAQTANVPAQTANVPAQTANVPAQTARLDLTCLFVEDADLLAAARLPGLREVSLAGEETSLDPARLALDLQHAARAAEQRFEQTARRLAGLHAHLEHRFQIARGRLADELSRAATDADLVVLSRALRTTGLRPRTGRSFLGLVRQPGAVLLINEPWASGSSVVVLGDDQTAVDRAARIAELERLPLVVARRPADGPRPTVPAGAQVRELPVWDETAVAELCRSADARLLVAPAGTDLDWAELLVSLVDRVPCSLLKLPSQP